MKKPIICLIFFLAIILSLAGKHAFALTNCPIAQTIGDNQSVVMILGYNPETNTNIQATGFFLNKQGDVVTNHHILSQLTQLQIRTALGQCYEVTKILKKDVFGDLAILRVAIPEELIAPVQLAAKKTNPGQEIYVVGHPLGHPQNKEKGVVAALFPFTKTDSLIQFTAPIAVGSSGSPIFNSDGYVVGIASFMLFSGQDALPYNYGIPISRLQYLQ